MNNTYIINEIESYNNIYDLEKRFPDFIDKQISNSKNRRESKKLIKDILAECKKNHNYLDMLERSVELIKIKMPKSKVSKLIDKLVDGIISPVIVGVVVGLIIGFILGKTL